MISVLLAALLTLSNIYLPFVPSVTEIPNEILSRTQPTPNDLIMPWPAGWRRLMPSHSPTFRGTAGCCHSNSPDAPLSVIGIGIALGRWDIAGGATLLFLTNAVTIAFAAFWYFHEGSRPQLQDEGRLPRTVWVSAYSRWSC